MGGLLLYSTNTWISWHIKRNWYRDVHFVWCSDYFDPGIHGPNHPAALIPPSSSPAELYRRLQMDVSQEDKHSELIGRNKAKLKDVATGWKKKEEISEDDLQEIWTLIDNAGFKEFRPILYIIPRKGLSQDRIIPVDIGDRAGLGIEYKILELKGSEFDMIRYEGA